MFKVAHPSATEAMDRHWSELECPLEDGIFFRDGRSVLFGYANTPSGWITLPSLVRLPHRRTDLPFALEPDTEWASLAEIASCTDSARDLRLSCGEGTMGGDGFVAAESAGGRVLNWIAYFTRSNPFCAVHIELEPDVTIVVQSTFDHIWRFPLEAPEAVSVGLPAFIPTTKR